MRNLVISRTDIIPFISDFPRKELFLSWWSHITCVNSVTVSECVMASSGGSVGADRRVAAHQARTSSSYSPTLSLVNRKLLNSTSQHFLLQRHDPPLPLAFSFSEQPSTFNMAQSSPDASWNPFAGFLTEYSFFVDCVSLACVSRPQCRRTPLL